jgi:hypothetical protein
MFALVGVTEMGVGGAAETTPSNRSAMPTD